MLGQIALQSGQERTVQMLLHKGNGKTAMCHRFHNRKYSLQDIPLPEAQGGTAWDWDQFLEGRVFKLFGSLQSAVLSVRS